MIYCIEIERGGIGEEDIVLHKTFDKEPSYEDVQNWIMEQDMGYDKNYCSFDFYRVD